MLLKIHFRNILEISPSDLLHSMTLTGLAGSSNKEWAPPGIPYPNFQMFFYVSL